MQGDDIQRSVGRDNPVRKGGGRLCGTVLATVVGLLAATALPAKAAPETACAYLSGLIPVDGGPLFLPSYPTAPDGPLRGVAFLYDDAVAAIALVGCGEPARARRIGDAIMAALDHDRAWRDGRLRNAYAAGPVRDNPVKLAGWWDKQQNRWLEDGYQVGSDNGNMAWAMLALLALPEAQGGPRYRDAALRIGNWISGYEDRRGAGGFTGGLAGWEPAPTPLTWKSTEHNTDIAAAFTRLFKMSGDPVWAKRADIAARFVAAMWDDGCACFAVGAKEDGVTPNLILALDAEIWPLIALPALASAHGDAALATVEKRLRVGAGYSYSDAELGFWTEGTAQAGLVAELLGHHEAALALGVAVAAQRAPYGGYFATAGDALATGFADPTDPSTQRFYYRLPHLAAAGWAALAETGFNPFTGAQAMP